MSDKFGIADQLMSIAGQFKKDKGGMLQEKDFGTKDSTVDSPFLKKVASEAMSKILDEAHPEGGKNLEGIELSDLSRVEDLKEEHAKLLAVVTKEVKAAHADLAVKLSKFASKLPEDLSDDAKALLSIAADLTDNHTMRDVMSTTLVRALNNEFMALSTDDSDMSAAEKVAMDHYLDKIIDEIGHTEAAIINDDPQYFISAANDAKNLVNEMTNHASNMGGAAKDFVDLNEGSFDKVSAIYAEAIPGARRLMELSWNKEDAPIQDSEEEAMARAQDSQTKLREDMLDTYEEEVELSQNVSNSMHMSQVQRMINQKITKHNIDMGTNLSLSPEDGDMSNRESLRIIKDVLGIKPGSYKNWNQLKQKIMQAQVSSPM